MYLLLKKSQLFPLLCTSLPFLFKSFLKFKQSKQIKYKLFCCERLQKECISGSAMSVDNCLFLQQSFSFIGWLSPTINLFLNIKATKMNDVFITFVPSVRFQLLATSHTLLSSALICYNTQCCFCSACWVKKHFPAFRFNKPKSHHVKSQGLLWFPLLLCLYSKLTQNHDFSTISTHKLTIISFSIFT